ncbi:MAG: TIGR03620 family F420-dependent LLM class oxidoreductase [Candidatus Dormibacteraeota bacterium]|nr:TIGR03620 family F420-dependent LLM class oxidoreductase [Candidatus Dormibacteraeota bacterium]
MGSTRLGRVQPGATGIFAGSLAAQPAAVIREVVGELEELGFGTLWYGEAIGREAFAFGALLLAAGRRLVVASGIANIWVRDPTAMANGARALQDGWPDRFILGLGVSHAPMVGSRGHPYARPVSSMRQYLERLAAAAWRGPEVELPPIVLAALGPMMVGLAAERTAGVYPYFTSTEHVRAIREAMGDEPFVAADLPVVLARDRATARQIGDRHMSLYLRTANYRNNLLRLGWPAAELEPPGSDRLFDAIVVWGDVDAVGRGVATMRAAGADHVVLNLVTADPTIPFREELRALSRLNR